MISSSRSWKKPTAAALNKPGCRVLSAAHFFNPDQRKSFVEELKSNDVSAYEAKIENERHLVVQLATILNIKI